MPKLSGVELENKATQLRLDALNLMARAQKGHIGGSFSCMDILVALYYGDVMKFDPANPDWEERDRFILSKGHATLALYPLLADLGFFNKSELDTYCQEDSIFEGHPNREIPGIEMGTGSLGQGLGIGTGLALAAKMDGKNYKTFVLLGDGECYEGSVWEAAQFASHHHLNNLIAIVDRNKQCVLDFTENCNKLEPFALKWEAFGWNAIESLGNNVEYLIREFSQINSKFRPTVIIANTIKGKGVSFMERKLEWHNKLPDDLELELARLELET